MDKELEDALWAGDTDRLQELAPCGCCCFDHNFGLNYPAWQWGGCRGYGSVTDDDYESWHRHYLQHHNIDLNHY